MNKFHNSDKSFNPAGDGYYPPERGAHLGTVYVNTIAAKIRSILNENDDKIGIRKISEYLDSVTSGLTPVSAEDENLASYRYRKQFVEVFTSKCTIAMVINRYKGDDEERGNYIEPYEIQRIVNSISKLYLTLGITTNEMSKIMHDFKNSMHTVSLDADNRAKNKSILFTMERIKITMSIMESNERIANDGEAKSAMKPIKGVVTKLSDTVIAYIGNKMACSKIISYFNKLAKVAEPNDDIYDNKFEFVTSVFKCPPIDKVFGTGSDEEKTKLATSINGLFEKFEITADDYDSFLQEIEVLNKERPSDETAALLATMQAYVEKTNTSTESE